MKLWFALLLCMVTVTAFAQVKEVSGIVFDKESKARIAKVKVQNITTKAEAFNNLKGEFKINATTGDILIFTKPDHHPDTVIITSNAALAVYMKPLAIALREVTIRDTLQNPQSRLAATKSEYNKIYGSLGYRDLLNVSPGGAGLSIDALYNMFSKSGRNAAHLQEIIERDYKQNVIDYRFNKTFVKGITNLSEPALTDFMFKYRPGYYMVTTAGDYEFIAYIRTSLKRYLRNPRAYELSPLIPAK
ncbi:hypothetical protein FFF34_012750 [Inquilinus sp. KBS0705]|nr:hypothetical protein FFF34_012750 [Inquilinus sp. KBS0705]